jgi:hypothetical protein
MYDITAGRRAVDVLFVYAARQAMRGVFSRALLQVNVTFVACLSVLLGVKLSLGLAVRGDAHPTACLATLATRD